jgi:hypothetical protein
MRTLIAAAAAVAVALALGVTAGASPPEHFKSQFPYSFVDTTTCSFTIVGSFVFTNDGTQFTDGRLVDLQLHQSNVGTLVGNGVTLKEDEHTQTFVTFENGAATQAVHVGIEFHMVGPAGRVFQIAGRQVWEVEHGFDHTLISETGVDFDFDPATFCAAFQ